MNVAIDVFSAHDLRANNDRVLDVSDLIAVLVAIYERLADDAPLLTNTPPPAPVNVPLCTDLALNWLLNVYDP